MNIGNAIAGVISMMKEEEFWDKFNRKHNPQFFEKLKKKKTEKEKASSSTSTKRNPVFKVSD